MLRDTTLLGNKICLRTLSGYADYTIHHSHTARNFRTSYIEDKELHTQYTGNLVLSNSSKLLRLPELPSTTLLFNLQKWQHGCYL